MENGRKVEDVRCMCVCMEKVEFGQEMEGGIGMYVHAERAGYVKRGGDVKRGGWTDLK